MSIIYECNRCKKRRKMPSDEEINFDVSVEIRKQGSKDFFVHYDYLCPNCMSVLEEGIRIVLDIFCSSDNSQEDVE